MANSYDVFSDYIASNPKPFLFFVMLPEINLLVEKDQAGMRIDKLLSHHTNNLSRSQIQKFISSGYLHIAGKTITDCSHQVKHLDHVKLIIHTPEPKKITPRDDILLDIAYEDPHLLIINKQAGLTVHPGAGTQNDTLVNALAFHFSENLSSISGIDRPGIVHRLDRDTTGLMIIAKNNHTHALLAEMIQKKLVTREYIAFVYGTPAPHAGKVETLIGRDPKQRTNMKVLQENGKHALTYYQVQEVFKNNSISKIKCKLSTGRTHQIRVHMEYKKHPLIGDKIYGKNLNHNLKNLNEDQIHMIKFFPRQALHSYYLEFIHPVTKKEVKITTSLPQDMQNLNDILQK